MQMLHLKMIYQFILYILLLNKNQINSFKCLFLQLLFFLNICAVFSFADILTLSQKCAKCFVHDSLQNTYCRKKSRWSSLGLSALLKGKTAVVNGMSFVGFKPTTFWLSAQILNYKSVQHALWWRHVLDIIMSDWSEYRTLSNQLTVVQSS